MQLRGPLTLTLSAALLAAALLPVAAATTASAVAPPAAPTVAGAVWTPVDGRLPAHRGGLDRRVDPTSYTAYHLDLPLLGTQLDQAPSERAVARGTAPQTIVVPSPEGDLVPFEVAESPVMEPGLAAQHPDIATYAGKSIGDDPASIRLDVTPMGFHASVRGDGASWYVDPAYNGPDQGADALYLAYDGQDLPDRDEKLIEPEKSSVAASARRLAARTAATASARSGDTAQRVGEGGGAVAIQRTYRLALVTDPSYATYFTSSTDPATVNSIVTSEKVTLMNRVNQVYGDDLSIRMLLVDGNDQLNFNTSAQFSGTNGRCGAAACYTSADIGCGNVIDTNRYVIGQIIGADKFDIGHIMFGPDGDGGGVAYLGAVGTTLKAGGCTGLNPPTGDGFAIDYVAHEMGHEFGGNHTFNGTTTNCASDNRNASTSVEPGSGVTVMAYAGICGVDDLQPHSDPYFSQRSQTEIATFTRSTPNNVHEVQNVALSGFTTTGESFTISYGGATTSTVTVGSNYTAAGLKAALEAAEPSTATATVVGSKGATFSASGNGFQVTWSSTADIPTPTVTLVSGSFAAIVGTFDNGGPETNQGYNNPTPTGNHNPVVTAAAAKTIPQRTPFQLTGSATDPDGDALVYTWEQNDIGGSSGTGLNSNTKTAGPLFRVFGTYANVTSAGAATYHSPNVNVATSSPTRTFPDIAQVAAGATNAATGTCPSYTATTSMPAGATLDCYSEFLPVVTSGTRALNFRLTARDLGGADGGSDGGTAFADTAITVGTAGPFLVTSQGSASSVTGGSTGTLAWNVANTNTATYATNVKISFSTDGGLTYPTVLAASTPNDGSETVTWPNVATTQGRFKIEAVGNYFFDVNDGNITITPTSGAPTLTTGGTAGGATFQATSSDPLTSTPTITASSSSVDGTAITATSSTLPAGLALTRTTSSAAGTRPGTTQFNVTGTANVDPGTYPVTVTVSDGAATDQTVSFTVVVSKDTATLTYTGDTSGATGQRTVSATVADTDATPGTVTGTVAFTDQTTGNALCTATVASGAASCPFTAPASRVYQVVGTLTSPRYTGVSPAATLTVSAPATLTTGGTAAGGTFTAASSDPLDTTPTITASSSSVDGTAIAATSSTLPSGLALTRVSSSAAGTRPGTTQLNVTGTANVDPGTYPVTVTVSDGAAANQTVSFAVVVSKDAATVTYTGDTTGATGTRTVSVSVADADSTPGAVTGTVAFADQTTGDALCSATVASGAASCTFSAPTTRTYQVVGTLASPRYTGASSAATLTVSTPATLTTGGSADGGTFTAMSSDPLAATPTITASSSSVDGTAIAATSSTLPAGLVLTRTTSSAAGARPGTTQFDVTGTANVDPGSYPVTVSVADGVVASQTVTFTVVVVKDAATLTYTGDTAGATGTRTVSATVADTDATPGTVAGTIAFTDQTTGDALCSAPVTSGAASCTFTAPATRTYQVVATLTSTRYTGASPAAALVVTAPAPTLTVGGNADGATFAAASSDPLSTTPVITAASSSQDGGTVSATSSTLPTGLSLTRTASSEAGVRPGNATFAVTGRADVDSGTYPVSVTVADGAAPARTVSFTVVVSKDDAVVTYTGDTAGTTGTRSVSVSVADTDATPGVVTGTVAFTDDTTGDTLCTTPVLSGDAACTFSAPAARTYEVVATLTSTRYAGASDRAELVVTAPADTTAPQTRITAGPAAGSLVLPRVVTFRYASEPGATYRCTLAGKKVSCPAGGALTLRSPAAGSYDLSIAAVDAAGNVDPTPAARRFYVPFNDRALAVASGPWKRRSAGDSYRGTYSEAAKKGATLTFKVKRATTLALVYGKGSGQGKVDVYLGKKLLRTIGTGGARRTQVVSAIATFSKPTSGTVRIVTRTASPVRIEGLGVRAAR